jgi:hypothetical protein
MVKIDNIANSKELDKAEMEDIVGGNSIFQNNAVNANVNGGFSFASPQTNIAPVTQVDASTTTDVDLKNITKSLDAIGSVVGGTKI